MPKLSVLSGSSSQLSRCKSASILTIGILAGLLSSLVQASGGGASYWQPTTAEPDKETRPRGLSTIKLDVPRPGPGLPDLYDLRCRLLADELTPEVWAVRADFVLEVRILDIIQHTGGSLFLLSIPGFANYTVKVLQVLKAPRGFRGFSETDFILVGPFWPPTSRSVLPADSCVGNVVPDSEYILYLRASEIDSVMFNVFPSSPLTAELRNRLKPLLCDGCVEKPAIQETFENLTLREGYNLRRSCTLQAGKPAPEIVWAKDYYLIENSTDSSFEISTSGTTSLIKISSLAPQHSGWYMCLAKNLAGNDFRGFHLEVLPHNLNEVQLATVPTLVACIGIKKNYCLNGGICYSSATNSEDIFCRCPKDYTGLRCHLTDVIYDYTKPERISECVGLPFFVFGCIFLAFAILILLIVLCCYWRVFRTPRQPRFDKTYKRLSKAIQFNGSNHSKDDSRPDIQQNGHEVVSARAPLFNAAGNSRHVRPTLAGQLTPSSSLAYRSPILDIGPVEYVRPASGLGVDPRDDSAVVDDLYSNQPGGRPLRGSSSFHSSSPKVVDNTRVIGAGHRVPAPFPPATRTSSASPQRHRRLSRDELRRSHEALLNEIQQSY